MKAKPVDVRSKEISRLVAKVAAAAKAKEEEADWLRFEVVMAEKAEMLAARQAEAAWLDGDQDGWDAWDRAHAEAAKNLANAENVLAHKSGMVKIALDGAEEAARVTAAALKHVLEAKLKQETDT